ncbi:Zn-dependent hydrolase [Alphaproteobacteria bacterium GH1-50]|uniref:Zn-dependent hydrolase n=1 Tax=Kangsaoukella pontilimi TaxID=2691042 RepID=A0A7C9IK75_9RHOB|nr:MBL fold metallo-hydrolase [Kangsaoukella pontilimi]MXQ09402.1 Zn-dependent hydrolase [Kangsaoukella pontilimi]
MLRYILALALFATPLAAQERRPSHCIAIADAAPGIEYLHKASWQQPIEDEYGVRISYIDHSMFMIQTPGGIEAITDYNGFIGGVDFVPDVVTMNVAHSSHWTAYPDADIAHILPGWRQQDGPADYYIDLGEMLIRNVTTDIRGGFGGEPIRDGNSIFVFEVAGLCIGHLGHLHHEPTDMQYAALGRVDVLMAAVDGGLTVDTPTMVRIVSRLKSSIVLPMHWFSRGSLDRFLDGVSTEFAIDRTGRSSFEVSLRSLPSRPTIMVLEPRFLSMSD